MGSRRGLVAGWGAERVSSSTRVGLESSRFEW
jgi:hypothetical protein